MKKLYVYADFDWFKEAELIGELGYESLRGAGSNNIYFSSRSPFLPMLPIRLMASS